MCTNKLIKSLTIFSFLLFLLSDAIFAFDQDSISAQAFQFFDAKNYQKAAPLFKKLLQTKPNAEFLNYYYGVCETENRNFSKIILSHLEKANNEEAPGAIGYYLGQQYQAAENWQNALKQYNRFKLKNNDGDLKDVNDKIEQCFQKINPFKDEYIFTEDELVEQLYDSGVVLIEEEAVKENSEIQPDSVFKSPELIAMPDSVPEIIPETSFADVEKEIPLEKSDKLTYKSIDLAINSNISYNFIEDFQTEQGKLLFMKADSAKHKLDSVLINIQTLRENYAIEKSTQKKQIIAEEILALENESFRLKNENNTLIYQSAVTENEFWQTKNQNEIDEFIQNQIERNKLQLNPDKNQLGKKTNEEKISIPDFLVSEVPEKNDLASKTKTDELIYKIQIGAFSRGLPSYIERLYKKLSYIRKIENYTDENGVVVYTTGNLANLEDALIMQNQVRQEGVEDAIVVPYFNGKRITLEQAKKLSGEK